ncbi:GNAT family N-acetyltransferase [Glaciibacter psychrotolerans]|uniref:N-acetyltransferase n=1 Tax=Glaciibacter psychrotolerans TaxID=670054 RepID=A0A7Z0EG20_9MICO|nr:GNAT family N-acetyltransferase [Leifsonia psychrotolerans]NYJ20848.1 hypothetical protein [Leifsonia psychrotolerans]
MDPEPNAPSTTVDVRHEPEQSRYTIWRNGEAVGLARYSSSARAITFVHTEVDPQFRGAGLASTLVRCALDDVREHSDLPVVSQCPYLSSWLTTHADYQDLLTRGT